MTSRGAQMQNLVRARIDPEFFVELNKGRYDEDPAVFELVRNNIRGFIMASPGHELVAGDYSQIELRVAAWLGGETWLMKHLSGREDVYKGTAARILGCSPDEVTPDQRQVFKSVELACQFGLSPTGLDGEGGLYARLRGEGFDVSREECKQTVDTYRRTHPAIVSTWAAFEDAVYILVGAPIGTEVTVGVMFFKRAENAIIVQRPSGFRQYLWFPWIEHDFWPDGGEKQNIRYSGRGKVSMNPHFTYGSKIFQGAVQGIAADVMYEGLLRVPSPILSVHDEACCELPIGAVSVEELCELLCEPIKWAPDLVLKAEGWSGPRYTKG